MNHKIAIASAIFSLMISAESYSTSDKIEYDYPTKRIETTFPDGDGKITIYSYNFNETVEAKYRTGDKYDTDELEKIVHIFRSRSDGKEFKIDIALIELLDHLQDHFNADAIELISGFRSANHNNNLRKNGADVAESSLHMEGKAADIHIDEVTEEMLAEYLRSVNVGGVGYYPANDFVHVDTGDKRKWDAPDHPGRLLTAFRKGLKWQLMTGSNIYLPKEEIAYEIMNTARMPESLESPPELMLFRRGKWIKVRDLFHPNAKQFKAGEKWQARWMPSENDPYGKYRIIIPGPRGYSHLEARSNEFYRKSK